MIGISARSVVVFLIAGVIFITLPIAIFFTFCFFMARLITRDNAGILFDKFQRKLDTGSMVRDGPMAADVAERAYREQMHATPMDGWGKPFRIGGEFANGKCVLTVESAGPDGAFGTADDVSILHTFELLRQATKVVTTGP